MTFTGDKFFSSHDCLNAAEARRQSLMAAKLQKRLGSTLTTGIIFSVLLGRLNLMEFGRKLTSEP
jgi:hypothetical protein